MYKRIQDGGLKILHFDSQVKSLLLNWVKRIFSEREGKWKYVFQAFIPIIDITDLFLTRCCIQNTWDLPLFYKNLLNIWNRFRRTSEPSDGNEVRNEFLWFNDFILKDKKPIFLKRWYRAGIKRIHDILDNRGDFISQQALFDKYGLETNF